MRQVRRKRNPNFSPVVFRRDRKWFVIHFIENSTRRVETLEKKKKKNIRNFEHVTIREANTLRCTHSHFIIYSLLSSPQYISNVCGHILDIVNCLYVL
ncbi:hypothetical protein PUN28_003975 [Cardiocondyla obscurior]|uniref:Uncharacterized protein n=1 Tax=Cardiocondyla obscurior TaxID=286306 RepID=A0AAW2GL45_9HYME